MRTSLYAFFKNYFSLNSRFVFLPCVICFADIIPGPHLSLIRLQYTAYLEDCYGNRLPGATGYHYISARESAGMSGASGRQEKKKRAAEGEVWPAQSAKTEKSPLRGFFCYEVRSPAICKDASGRSHCSGEESENRTVGSTGMESHRWRRFPSSPDNNRLVFTHSVTFTCSRCAHRQIHLHLSPPTPARAQFAHLTVWFCAVKVWNVPWDAPERKSILMHPRAQWGVQLWLIHRLVPIWSWWCADELQL